MIFSFSKLPIKTKLIIMMMTISCTAILLVTLINDLVNVHQDRRDAVAALRAIGAVVAFNSRAAVAFNDADAAKQMLSAFQFEPEILQAVLLVDNARPFAEFLRKDQPQDAAWQSFDWPGGEVFATHEYFSDDFLYFYQPVVIEGELIGKLFIKAELSSLRERYLLTSLISLGALLVAGVVAYFLTLRLQRLISEPLQQLVGEMGEVFGDKRDEEAPQIGRGADEIGVLLDGFKRMLARINQHERQLTKVNAKLEERVKQRTAELVLANDRLTSEVNRRVRIEKKKDALLAEKELLLREIHHRVKNNLQVITSLISLQLRKNGVAEGRSELLSVRERIRSMALIHEQLYRGEDLNEVAFDQFIRVFIDQLAVVYGATDRSIAVREELHAVNLSVDQAVPCGMILSELLGNAFKHAFLGRKSGNVVVTLRQVRGFVMLSVEDNGRGGIDKATRSLGLTLVHNLAEQLNGEMTFIDANGSRAILKFPFHVTRATAILDQANSHKDTEKDLI